MNDFAHNLHRLMARQGLSIAEVVQRSQLDERTVKNLLRGQHRRPHARTLHQLARGLEVSTDELFAAPTLSDRAKFDRESNPLVSEVVAARPELFAAWNSADFDELYSRFGAGGALSFDGTLDVVNQLNRRRELMRKVAILFETDQRDLLSGIVDLLYRQTVVDPTQPPSASVLLRSAG